jgi:hypothetical protein
MELFLNGVLRKMNQEPQDFDRLSFRFLRSMKNNSILFGEHAFRKSMAYSGGGRSVINIALFDVFSVLLADAETEKITQNRDVIIKAAASLLGKYDFNDAISRSTNSSRNVSLRFRMAREILQPLIV